MKIINGCRRSGKTTKVLEELETCDLYVAPNMNRCMVAYQDWINIHKPERVDRDITRTNQSVRPTFVTYGRFFGNKIYGIKFRNVYIEEFDDYMQSLAASNGVTQKVVVTTRSIIEQLPMPDTIKKMVKEYGPKGIVEED